jgi:hypothetical protein
MKDLFSSGSQLYQSSTELSARSGSEILNHVPERGFAMVQVQDNLLNC